MAESIARQAFAELELHALHANVGFERLRFEPSLDCRIGCETIEGCVKCVWKTVEPKAFALFFREQGGVAAEYKRGFKPALDTSKPGATESAEHEVRRRRSVGGTKLNIVLF